MSGFASISETRLISSLAGRAAVFALALLWLAGIKTEVGATSSPQHAANAQVGSETGLPVPRFVSLRSDRVNMRQGPSKDHSTIWIFRKAGLPVEITAEFGNWRKIRDADGSEGWVLHSLLSGRRTVIVSPWEKNGLIEMYGGPDAKSGLKAKLEPRIVANVKKCDQEWCRVTGAEFDGYVQQKKLWGVYPDEQIR